MHLWTRLNSRRRELLSIVAVLFLILVAVAGCSRVVEKIQSLRSAPTATATIPADTPTAAVVAPTPTPADLNVALKGTATASGGQDSAAKAIDGNPDTAWGAGGYPVQWFMVTLDKFYLVSRIELLITLAPAGKTSHEVWLGDSSGGLTLYKTLTNVPTTDGQTLTVTLDPAQPVNRVMIRTTSGPSFVAWREVRVFGHEAPAGVIQQVAAPGTAGWIDWPSLGLSGGFDLPVQATNAGDGSGRMFVVEQRGTIRVLKGGQASSKPFLDLTDRVKCCGEQGLLSIAFPPGYAKKQYFYVSWTDQTNALVIARFHTTADPDVGDPSSLTEILRIPEPTVIHHSGHMVFGPKDGFLYIGSGDGGEPADQNKHAQDPSLLLGKLLRIDVESGVTPYAIPPSNPFVGKAGYRPEIWDLGLRNPWGFDFDTQTGDLFIGDVGEDTYESLDYQPASGPAGLNFRWPIMEGLHCFAAPGCSQTGLTLPVLEYVHADGGCGIIGGTVYRGVANPRMQGIYYYGDLCSGRVWGIERVGDSWKNTMLLTAPFQISSIGQDEAGELWLTDYNHGSIARLLDVPPATPTPAP
jgi:glucose/arabinose dehydrogenase